MTMALSGKPLLMLTALHLRSMLSMPLYFWRVRSLERVLRQQSGLLRSHRWVSRRSLLLISWWRDREAAEAWLAHPAHQRLLRRGEGRAGVGLWVELYELTPGGIHLGTRGAPQGETEPE